MQTSVLFQEDDWAISQIIAGWLDVRLHYTDSAGLSLFFDCEPCFEDVSSDIRGLSVFTAVVYSSLTDNRTPVQVPEDVLCSVRQKIKHGLLSIGYVVYNV